jgi:hypothetical protein
MVARRPLPLRLSQQSLAALTKKWKFPVWSLATGESASVLPILPIGGKGAHRLAPAFGSRRIDHHEDRDRRRSAPMNNVHSLPPVPPGVGDATHAGDHPLRRFVSDRAAPTTFLLGVGCQKGGTTWLFDYLQKHSDAVMGFRKEYHVLDAIHLPSCRMFVEAETACGRRVLDWFSRPRRDPADCTMLDFYADIENYFEYFRHLATRQPGVRLVGDMTPSYAGLPPEVFASVRQSLERRGFAVKALFLMRDPVDRVWSAVRMMRRQSIITGGSDAAWVRKFFRTPEFEFRTRYDETIRNLETAFSAEHLHFQFYEKLFSTGAIRAITDFLGLRFIEPNTKARSNASPKTEDLPGDLQRAIAEFYAPVYDFCVARFGDNLIRKIWPSYRFLTAEPSAIAA